MYFKSLSLSLVFFCTQLAFGGATALSPASSSARVLKVSDDAWAGSSVNMSANQSSNLFTYGETQYAAYYDSTAHLILAKRTLGSDFWETRDTGCTGNASDAHNTIALTVDGKGFLHVAWNHHDNALHYAKGVKAGSIELGPQEAMTGTLESSVTYPMFFSLTDGNLLFLYRDGHSGLGNVVLKRYDADSGKWTLLHDNMISGENDRSAYISATLDPRGTLHLAWTWRETPDVATNHDLCYARSTDGGVTWTDSAGKPFALPITSSTAEYAAKIPQKSSLMNPPSVAAGWKGTPAIVDYWADTGSGIPQWHVVTLINGKWTVVQASARKTAFTLAGTSTKHPPISRAVVLADSRRDRADALYIVYRDDERGGRAVVLSCPDIEKPEWTLRELTAAGLDAWEPSCDPVQWNLLNQLHMLVEKVHQPDGSDTAPASAAAPIGSLIWSPSVAAWMETPVRPLPPVDETALNKELNRDEILALMEKCADWQLAHLPGYSPAGREVSPFYIGTMALAKISTEPRFKKAMLALFEKNGWMPAERLYDADDHCVMQAYLDMWELEKQQRMIEPSREVMNRILDNPPKTSLFFGTKGSRDRWSWCDALFMGPAAWAAMSKATDDSRYMRYMDKEWWATTDYLFQPADGLFLRDNRFRDLREPNGRRIYWGRGNGWVVAGLCRVIDQLPEDHPSRLRYIVLYRRMMTAVLAAQQPDGMWRSGLLDPAAHAERETSGSAFYTYALAWGVNRNLIDRSRIMPAVRKAWNALALCVEPDGKLTNVQPTGDAPQGFDPEHTEPFGVGAFLLAGSEVWRACGWR